MFTALCLKPNKDYIPNERVSNLDSFLDWWTWGITSLRLWNNKNDLRDKKYWQEYPGLPMEFKKIVFLKIIRLLKKKIDFLRKTIVWGFLKKCQPIRSGRLASYFSYIYRYKRIASLYNLLTINTLK